jgi:hypothetical protein
MNGTRNAFALSDEELTMAGDVLGHPVTQTHAKH